MVGCWFLVKVRYGYVRSLANFSNFCGYLKPSLVVLLVKNLPAKAGDAKRQGSDPWVGKIPWRRKWQRTPAFLPGEFHGQRVNVSWVESRCVWMQIPVPRLWADQPAPSLADSQGSALLFIPFLCLQLGELGKGHSGPIPVSEVSSISFLASVPNWILRHNLRTTLYSGKEKWPFESNLAWIVVITFYQQNPGGQRVICTWPTTAGDRSDKRMTELLNQAKEFWG